MTSGRTRVAKARTSRVASMLVAGALSAGLLAVPAAAQDEEARLRRIEAEVRALQRAVFPGADGRYFTPEVTTGQQPQQPQPPVTTPSGGALTDVLARLEAVEAQMARLTARTEETSYQLGQFEDRLEALESAPAPQPLPGVLPAQPSGVINPPGAAAPTAAAGGSAVPAPVPAAGAPSPERVAAVQAIAKPATDDPGDDEYTYGFRLWDAGFYPEAQQQLALFLERYPDHSRATFGRNLLGRAYLDNGQPREAATHFFENYQSDRQGARAPDSLLYLAEAMVAIGDTNRACIALAEFGDTYPALATGRLQGQYERNRARVTCS